MFKQTIFILLSILLGSCSLDPPEWLQGQWKKKDDSSKVAFISVLNINDNGFFSKTSELDSMEIKSTLMITITEIIEENRYIIRRDHSLEKEPYFEIFKLNAENEVLYYDSSSILPRQEYILTRISH